MAAGRGCGSWTARTDSAGRGPAGPGRGLGLAAGAMLVVLSLSCSREPAAPRRAEAVQARPAPAGAAVVATQAPATQASAAQAQLPGVPMPAPAERPSADPAVLVMGPQLPAVPAATPARTTPAEGLSPDPGVMVMGPQQPSRPAVIYASGGKRDPFRSLIGDEDGQEFLLDLEGARLVGAGWDEDQIVAMVEDRQGRTYALRVGDRVRSGKLVSVAPERAVFDLWLYGRSERRVLEVSREEEK